MVGRGALKTNLKLWPRSHCFLAMTGALLPHKLPHKLWKAGRGQSAGASRKLRRMLGGLASVSSSSGRTALPGLPREPVAQCRAWSQEIYCLTQERVQP